MVLQEREPMVYAFIVSQSPQLSCSQTKWGKCMVTMEPHANGQPTYNGVLPDSQRGSFITLLLILQCHAAFSRIYSTLAWVGQSLLASLCHCNPLQGVPSKPVIASHLTQGTETHIALKYR
jgi:hypothetical protein